MYLEKDKSYLFGLPFRHLTVVPIVLSNIYNAAVEENLLDYFLESEYNYCYKDNYFSLEYNLCNYNIRLSFDIKVREDGEVIGSWAIDSSYKYNLLMWSKEEFDCSFYENIDNEIHIAMNYLKKLIQVGEN